MKIEHILEDFISNELSVWDFSGVIRVIKKGKIIYETSRGLAHIEFGIKNTMSTGFNIASVTKQFTAFAVMILSDKGLINIHKKANHYLPLNIQVSPEITVHHLLSHTSGLYNYYTFEDDFYVLEDRLPYNKIDFVNRWINKKRVNEPVNIPGQVFNYNNSNYNLLAWIIEHVSGMEYEEFLKKYIFIPLGMEHSDIDNGQKVLFNKASNYMHDYGEVVRVPYTNPLYSIGAGAMVTNCDDIQRWYECLKNREILSEKGYELYFKENMNHYCYGLERYEDNESVTYRHGGDFLGTSAYTQYFFEEDICIIILSNTESLNQYRVGNSIAGIMFGTTPKINSKPEEIRVTHKELKRYTGTYLPGKIQIEEKDGTLYLVRVNQNIHIELYCVGKHLYMRRYEEQQQPHCLLKDGAVQTVWGFDLVSKD